MLVSAPASCLPRGRSALARGISGFCSLSLAGRWAQAVLVPAPASLTPGPDLSGPGGAMKVLLFQFLSARFLRGTLGDSGPKRSILSFASDSSLGK